MHTPKILPPHYFVLSILLMVGIALTSAAGFIGPPLTYAGLLPMLIGVILAVKASRQFSAAGTNIIPLTASTTLVTDGAFRWMRNPMYSGMIMFLAGLACLLDSPWCWAVVGGFFFIIRQHFVLREEKLMAQTFAHDYAAYRASVRRWI